MAFEQGHPQLVGRYLLNPDLLPPGDLGPLLSSGKVDYADLSDPVVPGARVLHVMWPFDPGVPIGRIWPRWAHKQGVRLCATVCHPISSDHGGSSLDDLRLRARHSGGLEVLRAADALLTTSLAASRSLEKNLAVGPTRLHAVGWGTEQQFVPVKPGENAYQRAQASVPALERSFVLYPARGDVHDNIEALITAFGRLPAPLRSSHQLVVPGHLPEPAANHLRDVADAEGVGGRVLFPGAVSKEVMLRLYQATELVCFPSLSHDYSPAVSEAMACGAVTVVSDLGVLGDLVSPAATFRSVKPGGNQRRNRTGAEQRSIPRGSASACLDHALDVDRRRGPDGRGLRSTARQARPAMAPSSSGRDSLAVPSRGFRDRELQLPPRRGTVGCR